MKNTSQLRDTCSNRHGSALSKNKMWDSKINHNVNELSEFSRTKLCESNRKNTISSFQDKQRPFFVRNPIVFEKWSSVSICQI